jgi:hypothetical protein
MTESLPDLAVLLESWGLAMRAERKAPGHHEDLQRRRDRFPALV